MAEIHLINITKRWGDFVAVQSFDLKILDKEFLVLLGPSGCGKSTTMRMIAGLEDVTEGEIMIDGKRVNNLEPKDRDIAMVFQSYALYPNMSVYENIRFPLKVRKVDPELHNDRVMQASAMVELDNYLHRKPSELSGGQRQRIGIARALYKEADVIVFDEATSALDNETEVAVMEAIENLGDELTVIIVAHRLTTLKVCTHIVELEDGKIKQSGSYSDIIAELN